MLEDSHVDRTYYVLQCRAAKDDTGMWVCVFPNDLAREKLATATYDAIKALCPMSHNLLASGTEYGWMTKAVAMLALQVVHAINPSPFEWRVVERRVRIEATTKVVGPWSITLHSADLTWVLDPNRQDGVVAADAPAP
jgi:hypothetical protein